MTVIACCMVLKQLHQLLLTSDGMHVIITKQHKTSCMLEHAEKKQSAAGRCYLRMPVQPALKLCKARCKDCVPLSGPEFMQLMYYTF